MDKALFKNAELLLGIGEYGLPHVAISYESFVESVRHCQSLWSVADGRSPYKLSQEILIVGMGALFYENFGALVGSLAKDVSYNNAKRYFNL